MQKVGRQSGSSTGVAHLGFALALLVAAPAALAGAQQYEVLAAGTRTALNRSITDTTRTDSALGNAQAQRQWLRSMSVRLEKRIPDARSRERLLGMIHYEALRAGLDPQLVLAVIQVESGFKKYAISRAGARGLMQVMPFWVREIGEKTHNLFDERLNLRYGCTILRHYLDIERGNLYRALGRYNGSLGRAEYPTLVINTRRNVFRYDAGPAPLAALNQPNTPAIVD